jgi:ABC-type uncharacterized transport system ATPase subunit
MDFMRPITVLRKGHLIETCDISDVTSYDLVEKMVGRKIDLSIDRPDPDPEKKVCLEVKNLFLKNDQGYLKLKDMTFSLNHGEILGIAGLAGSGQKELCETIAGIIPFEKGDVLVDGTSISGKSPRAIIQMGVSLGFIPEDRLGMGLVASMDIADNVFSRITLLNRDFSSKPTKPESRHRRLSTSLRYRHRVFPSRAQAFRRQYPESNPRQRNQHEPEASDNRLCGSRSGYQFFVYDLQPSE